MPDIKIIFGSAGTGKTTYAYNHILKPMSDAEIADVVALSFTVAAKQALLEKEPRLKDHQVRTLHSIVYKELNLTREELITEEDIQEFMDTMGFRYNPENLSYEDDDFSEEAEGNILLRLWGKLHNEAPRYERTLGKVNIGRFIEDNLSLVELVGADTFKNFVIEYKKYQKQLGKFDYDSMLYEGYKEGVKIAGSILILDEAQDLSPLMTAILDQNINNFDQVVILGDDDQTIYTALNGAMAEYLLGKEGEKIILNKSWRLPKKVLQLAMQYIRQNRNRVDKEIEPREEEGVLRFSAGIPVDLLMYEPEVPTFILARHRKRVAKIIRLLEMKEIPYRILGEKKDLKLNTKKGSVISALKFYSMVKNRALDERVSVVMLANFLDMIGERLTYEIFGEPKETITGNYVLDKTLGQLIQDYPKLANIVKIPIAWLFAENTKDISIRFINKWTRRMSKLSQWERPNLVVGTIHQAKGLEADRVILDLSMNKKSYSDMSTEYERRVWFVGTTRARKELILARPASPSALYNIELEAMAEKSIV